jgi:hypothetical protein
LLTLGEGRAVSFEKGLSAGVEEFVCAGFAFVTLIVGLDDAGAVASSTASGTVAAGAEEEEEEDGPPLSVCCCSDLGVGVDDPDSFSSRRRRIYAMLARPNLDI